MENSTSLSHKETYTSTIKNNIYSTKKASRNFWKLFLKHYFNDKFLIFWIHLHLITKLLTDFSEHRNTNTVSFFIFKTFGEELFCYFCYVWLTECFWNTIFKSESLSIEKYMQFSIREYFRALSIRFFTTREKRSSSV